MSKPTGDSRILRTFARLDAEKRKLKDRLQKTEAELKSVEPNVINFFQQMGVQSFKIGAVTVYLRRELWAGKAEGVTPEAFHSALESAGLGDYVKPKVNTQSLSAWARELDEKGQPIPASLQAFVKVSEVFKIGSRKS